MFPGRLKVAVMFTQALWTEDEQRFGPANFSGAQGKKQGSQVRAVIHVEMSEKEKTNILEIDTAVPGQTPGGSRPQVNYDDPVPCPDKMTGRGPLDLGNGRAGTDGYVTHEISSGNWYGSVGVWKQQVWECGGTGVWESLQPITLYP